MSIVPGHASGIASGLGVAWSSGRAPLGMALATRPLQHGLHLHRVDTDRMVNPVMGEFATLAKPVNRCRTHSEDLCDLPHGEKLAHRPEGFVVRRWAVQQGSCRSRGFGWWKPVQQGSSKILAQACMDLHIFAFLVGHTSRICTGLHVLARIRRYVNILYESEGHWFKSSRARQNSEGPRAVSSRGLYFM